MPTPAALSWWHDARFGMFIHWGLYALLARHEWTMYQESIPPEEYRGLADRFNPQHYNPEEWVAVVKPGRIMFELEGVPVEIARRAMELASFKLPIKTRFVIRETQL